ncbi:SDR family NAD(P)-dependent oxidoreductase [Streptosporangium lutulentum]|uniref:Short chain dehydrogenase n=1 Tax=Streptosporangium lutulentum TaxID=1461250 RepID=A0ABT9QBP9_9ACTN|nr:SDR family NAD(P)-dependent oxidoreductase [Streptosporangium lutulentum]MDP9844087.1 hypothetical protein [Streptosporangium lutulentum]
MKTWLIAGCSTGFGRHLAQAVLAHGHRVVVTARDVEQVADLAREGGRHALAMKLDVTDHEQVVSTIGRIMSAFGGIDVLVNNSGVGCFAAAGRSPGDQIRRAGLSAFGLPDEVLLVEPSELHIGRILCPRAETALAEELGRTPTAGTRRAAVRESVGSDGDDPEHAAMAIIKAVDADPPPPRLSFGHDAYEFTLVRLGELRGRL